MKNITGKIQISQARLSELQKKSSNIPDLKKQIGNSADKKTTQLLELLLGSAFLSEASDLHIEPREKQALLRLRMDGILQDVTSIPLPLYRSLLSRIKLLSEMKLNVSDRPQDGRFSIVLNKMEVEIRSSALPAEHGETVVMRILNPKTLIEMEKLGLRQDLLKDFRKEIKKPNGMVIVTGPTGSGKTTTLYAFLKKIQRREIKIITIEDPIEYHLKGISQTQVNPSKGYDFANGLQSIMRQDPDVILVGEIRNLETAKIALQAALTGHLVLTTLHTNDAAGTIARLISLGADPSNIGPAINLAIAQRLVRQICPKCGKMEKPSPEELKKIKNALKGLPKGVKTPKITDKIKIPKAKGCPECNHTGYKGRIGIFEGFPVDEEMEKFILTSPSIAVLRKMAVKKGMVLMKQDGFIKILQGVTTVEEVERMTGK